MTGDACLKGLNIFEAVELLVEGHRVTRESWKGRLYLVMVNGDHSKRPPHYRVTDETGALRPGSWIAQVSDEGDMLPWQNLQSDLFAEDFITLPPVDAVSYMRASVLAREIA